MKKEICDKEYDIDSEQQLTSSALDSLLNTAQTMSRPEPRHTIMTIYGLNDLGGPIVEHRGQTWDAISTVPIKREHIGQNCLVTYAENHTSPIVTGIIWQPKHLLNTTELIEADTSLRLRCGKSSLTLEADGTVCLKGVTVTTQAYGANRVKGAAVKIN